MKTNSTLPEFTFQHWLAKDLEVCCVFELATGLSFPRRGNLWTGLYCQLEEIKKIMLAESEPQKLGYFVDLWLKTRTDR